MSERGKRIVEQSGERAVADLAERSLLASVELTAAPERVFRALASKEIIAWWINPGVFNTADWSGDVKVGGRWKASGVGRGRAYGLEGEFREIDAPRKLVHTWSAVGAPAAPSTVTYFLEPAARGTRLTLRQEGFAAREICLATCVGWETSFEQLALFLSAEVADAPA
jgi:uncharacterized protein YndB with AHSA1/START domain